MNDLAVQTDTQAIVVDEIFPHAPATIWKALTSGDLIARWLMAPTGFEPVAGNRFTFQTTPAGEWDGVIHCRVLEVVPCERFVYGWRGGHESNDGYGAPLDTMVTWTLTRMDHGTRVRLVHSGFVLPKNDTAYRNMSDGWKKVLRNLDNISAESHLYSGGCACGAIRYEINGEPLFMNHCQCRDCQHISGTGHGSYLTFARDGVKLEGQATHWDIVADSGNVKTRAFCPTCGSPVYMTFAANPGVFTVHSASLDDPGCYQPQVVTYAMRGYAWDHLDPAMAKFDKMPPG